MLGRIIYGPPIFRTLLGQEGGTDPVILQVRRWGFYLSIRSPLWIPRYLRIRLYAGRGFNRKVGGGIYLSRSKESPS